MYVIEIESAIKIVSAIERFHCSKLKDKSQENINEGEIGHGLKKTLIVPGNIT